MCYSDVSPRSLQSDSLYGNNFTAIADIVHNAIYLSLSIDISFETDDVWRGQ